MLIDIDIKIADNEGKLIQHFSKQFDEKLNISDKIEKRNGLKKEFEEFLAEYLTASGRTVREKLIYNPYISNSCRYKPVIPTDKSLFKKEDLKVKDMLAFSELEYKIRLGNNKEITGEIPLYKLNRLHKLTNVLNAEESDKIEASDENMVSNQSDYVSLFTNSDYNFNKKEATAILERDLKNLMLQAIEKYESNFYHISEEINTD